MKRFLLIVLMVCASALTSHAQLYVGGVAGFSYSHFKMGADAAERGGNASFKFLPEVGYMFKNNMGAGLSIGYVKGLSALGSFDPAHMQDFMATMGSLRTEFNSSVLGDQQSMGAFRLAPYFRWNFYSTGRLSLFLDSVLGLNFGSIRTLDGDAVVKTGFTTFELSARPGIAFRASDHITLMAKLGGFGFQYAGANGTVANLTRFGLDLDPSNLMFGVVYTMKKRFGKR